MTSINLIEKNSSGVTQNTYKIYCNNVKIGWANSIDAKPYANSLSTGVSEIQKNGFENPIYTINSVTLTNDSGSLTYPELVRLSKFSTGSSSNYLELSIDYGLDTSSLVIDSAENSLGIKVVVKSFNIGLGLDKKHNDSILAMSGTIILQESS